MYFDVPWRLALVCTFTCGSLAQMNHCQSLVRPKDIKLLV